MQHCPGPVVCSVGPLIVPCENRPDLPSSGKERYYGYFCGADNPVRGAAMEQVREEP